MMRHNSDAFVQLVEDFLIVVVTEHSFFYMRVKFDRDFLKIVVFLEQRRSCSLRYSIQEMPKAQSLLVFKTWYLGFDESYLTFKFFQCCSYNRLIFDWVQTASTVCDLTSNLKKLYSLPQNLEL